MIKNTRAIDITANKTPRRSIQNSEVTKDKQANAKPIRSHHLSSPQAYPVSAADKHASPNAAVNVELTISIKVPFINRAGE